ncbi:MAG: phenylalanine--tRNA ligase subunit beta [Porticoccaceae bacterium]|nr:phenylalanine--tRNA ligase subunit beta [Porticoccaceae bacterium]
MKFSEAWLRECVTLETDTEELIARMTMAGLEVDGVEAAAPDFSGVVVAEIKSAEAHPEADKLKVCQVSTENDVLIQVVCGAPNARPGLKVAFARVGAKLPGGTDIGEAELRGVASFGMLCSGAELGLSTDDSGLLELPADATSGVSLRDYLALNDTIIEVDLTPNRGDCLSMVGLAREAAVLYETTYSIVGNSLTPPSIEATFPVTLSSPEACPRYAGRVIKGIDINQPSPSWLKEKLRRGGIRSIDAVVDVTNYVMLELGQPMHAFDLDKLQGGIDVRFAKQGETLTLIGGADIELDIESLLITDQSGPLALAGIMGGASSGVSTNTVNIFLESAHFNPLNIAGKARKYALHTDSSHRFERGVDPELPLRALERASELLTAIVGGQAGPPITTEEPSAMPGRAHIFLRKARLSQQLRLSLDEGYVINILTRLGLDVEQTTEEGWQCLAPSWRFDLAIEADLIEEIARIYGYDNLPVAIPNISLKTTLDKETVTPLARMKQLMTARDYFEAITYSFVDEELQQLVIPDQPGVAVKNPISADMSVMRTSLITGLLLALKHNINRQQSRIRLFETGQRFIAGDAVIHQEVIAGVITGDRSSEGWANQNQAVDFYDIKGDVEALLSLSGIAQGVTFEVGEHPALQAGQSLIAFNNKYKSIGYIGKLHPNIGRFLDLNQSVYLFELDLQAITTGTLPAFWEITRFPSAKRDIAVLVDQKVSFSELRQVIESSAPEHLTDLKVFDVYEGKHLENNRKSIALSLTFQLNSRTLADDEVNSAVDKVVAALEEQCSAQLRG